MCVASCHFLLVVAHLLSLLAFLALASRLAWGLSSLQPFSQPLQCSPSLLPKSLYLRLVMSPQLLFFRGVLPRGLHVLSLRARFGAFKW